MSLIRTTGIICFNKVIIKSLSVLRSCISSNIICENPFNAGSDCINCKSMPVVQNNILPRSLGDILS